MAAHSNVYYIKSADGSYEPCKDAVGVKNDIGIDLFRHKDKIYDGSTGLRACDRSEIDTLLKKHDKESFTRIIQQAVEKYGLSPRYTEPDVKKEDLFPRNENKKLAKTLYHKEKCWFTRAYSENGIDLYAMDKEKSTSAMMFAPCKDWMIGIGPACELPKVIEFLTKPDFDLYSFLEQRFETSLQNPERWADAGIGEFLGRREEADRHNQPIEEARENKRNAEIEAREAERLEQEARAQAKYKDAIKGAETAILEKRPVSNREIGGQSLVLQLFRENNIELPLRTQGWVKSSLAEIKSTPHGWSYQYYGNNSTVFRNYLGRLTDAIEEKHSAIGRLAAAKEAVGKTERPDKTDKPKTKGPEL